MSAVVDIGRLRPRVPLFGLLVLGFAILGPAPLWAEVVDAETDAFVAPEYESAPEEAPGDSLRLTAPAPVLPAALTPPPLERVPPDAVVDLSSMYLRKYRFRMNMAYGGAGVMAAGLLPFSLAVALHEIWPCGGRDCISVNTVMGLAGLGGLSLFLVGAGATAHWSTVAAQALYDPKAPFRAIWMGRLSFIFWAISEVLLTFAIFAPGAGLFWAGTLFGLASIPLSIGQLVSTSLRSRDRDPGTPLSASRRRTLPVAQWSFAP